LFIRKLLINKGLESLARVRAGHPAGVAVRDESLPAGRQASIPTKESKIKI
jgi:hypothetical protein